MNSLTARSLQGNSLIDFRISTMFEAHSFQNRFIFEIITSSLSKGCLVYLHTLSSQPDSRSNNAKNYYLVI